MALINDKRESKKRAMPTLLYGADDIAKDAIIRLFHKQTRKMNHIMRRQLCEQLRDTFQHLIEEYGEAWTVEKVRDELPPIQVQMLDGDIVEGKIMSRHDMIAHIQLGGILIIKVSWSAVANCLNKKMPYQVRQ